jgi:hypothetical protein
VVLDVVLHALAAGREGKEKKRARAEAILGSVPSSASRLQSRVHWAGMVGRAGQPEQARAIALAALSDWDPIDAIADSGYATFSIFREFGAYDDLLSWVDSREGHARAGALISIISGLTLEPTVWQRSG